jgi:hypothetical protein
VGQFVVLLSTDVTVPTAEAPPTTAVPAGPESCRYFLQQLGAFSTVLAVKLYRMPIPEALRVPVLPCLDHEAMLHEGIAPHAAAYIETGTHALHEVVFIPDKHRIEVDVVSTMGECSDEAQRQLLESLTQHFPKLAVRVSRPSWLRGDRRVAKACRAQVTLREVLLGENLDRTKLAVDRLQTISSLMEKESRVASWGARTIMTPFLAVAGFVTYQLLGRPNLHLGSGVVEFLRYCIVGGFGALFVYYGMKAVHLTEMANRVWKRSAEYGLILGERRRLQR